MLMCICLFLERKENPDGPRHFYRDAKATKPQRRRIQSYMKPEYFKALPRSPTAMLLYMEGLFTRGVVKGRPRGAWGLPILGTTTKRSAFFNKHTIKVGKLCYWRCLRTSMASVTPTGGVLVSL